MIDSFGFIRKTDILGPSSSPFHDISTCPLRSVLMKEDTSDAHHKLSLSEKQYIPREMNSETDLDQDQYISSANKKLTDDGWNSSWGDAVLIKIITGIEVKTLLKAIRAVS